jgi:hypothetical protein
VDNTPPTVAGSPAEGQTLSASPGGWTNYPREYTYQWQRCDTGGGSCEAIGAANGASYVLNTNDVGHTLRVQVSASNASGAGQPATSAPTEVVSPRGNGNNNNNGGEPPPGGPNPPAGGVQSNQERHPSTTQIHQALIKALTSNGNLGNLESSPRRGSFLVNFEAPSAGEVVFVWYWLPPGAHLASAKPVEVGRGMKHFTHSGASKVPIKLTPVGRALLKARHHTKLIAVASFKPLGSLPVKVTKQITVG